MSLKKALGGSPVISKKARRHDEILKNAIKKFKSAPPEDLEVLGTKQKHSKCKDHKH